jgi:hypothetical protein
MKIESYDFGSITIDGRTYTRDLKIIGDRVVPNWWRKEGHNLLPDDIEDILEARPEILVVGMGHDGLMRVSAQVEKSLSEAGIRLIAKPTRGAVAEFNSLRGSSGVAFAAHLTC